MIHQQCKYIAAEQTSTVPKERVGTCYTSNNKCDLIPFNNYYGCKKVARSGKVVLEVKGKGSDVEQK